LAVYLGLKLGIGAGIEILDIWSKDVDKQWTIVDERVHGWDFPLATDDEGNPVRKPRADITISSLCPGGPGPPLLRGAPGPRRDVVCVKEVA
jgi:hypothetical protein